MKDKESLSGRSATLIGALLASLAAVALTLPASAPAYLYWPVPYGIARANLNGSNIRDPFIARPDPENGVSSLTFSGPYVFLTIAGSQGKIARENIDGSGMIPDLFSIPQPPREEDEQRFGTEINASSIAIDGTHLYWGAGTCGGKPTARLRPYVCWLGRANSDGTHVESGFIKTEGSIHEVRIYGHHIYWATGHSIARADLDGHNVQENFIPLPAQRYDETYAVGEDHIYWPTEHGVARANLNGRGINQQFITGLPYVYGVSVGAGYIYWNTGEEAPGSEPTPHQNGKPDWIGRADVDGTHIRQRIMTCNRVCGVPVVNALGPGGRQNVESPHTRRRHG